jgi:hypothetical protein
VNAIARFMDAAARHLGAKAPPSPTEADKPFSEPAHPANHQDPLTSSAMNIFSKHYPPSPLRPCPAANIGDVDGIFSSHDVQRAAATCCTKLAELADIAGYRSEIASAIETVVGQEGNWAQLGIARVLGALSRRAEEIDEAIAEARVDKAEHQDAHRAYLLSLQPLSAAVSALLTNLVNERATLDSHLVAMKTHSGIDAAVARFEALKAQGLTNEQINALGAARPDVEARAEKMRARIVEIDGIVARCHAFRANERDFSPLDGLGFDQLIETRRSAMQVPA